MYVELILSVVAVVLTILAMQKLKGIKHEYELKTGFLLMFVFVIVFFTCIWGARSGLGGISLKPPFKIIRAIFKMNFGMVASRSLLNILLFVPFGYLISSVVLLKKGNVKWWAVVLSGFAFSLVIETCQLVFKFGVFELDDLVKNTLGAALGYYIFYRLNTKRTNKTTE